LSADNNASGGLQLTQRRLFMLLGMLAVAAIIILRVQSLWAERTNVLEQRQAQATTLAQFAATYSARLYDQSGRVAREVAQYIRTNNPTDAALHDYLAARARDTSADDYIVVVNAAGRVRATSESPDPPSSVNFGRNVGSTFRAGAQEVLPVRRSRLTGAVIYSLSQRLEDGAGQFLGVVGVNVRPEGIRPVGSRLPDEPTLSVWKQDGSFIAASFVDFNAQGQAMPPSTPPGLDIPGSSKGAAELSASLPVQGWPLVAVASYDPEGVLGEWRRHVYEAVAMVLLSMLGIGALVWFGVRTADRESAVKQDLQDANALAAEALKHRDLLMREVDHRVKNSLMMTAGLLHLQARRFTDPEVREAFESTRGRLNSIGLVHEALYSGSSLEEVDLAAYLARLLDDLAGAYGAQARAVRIELEAESLVLPAHQTTPVGLIVAEVVTNAFKHAFGPEGSGTIRVRVRPANLNEIEIQIRDDGGGYSPPEPTGRASGLGTQLIDTLAQQLGGTLSLANDGGAAFRLTFPRLVRGEASGGRAGSAKAMPA
jgi:two-component sensor histidine kinase